MTEAQIKPTTVIRSPLMSGFCSFPETKHPEESHARCRGGSRSNPAREFQPCPCPCHYPEERYECGGCGEEIMEAPAWPAPDDPEEDGEVRYTHVSRHTGRATGEQCGG